MKALIFARPGKPGEVLALEQVGLPAPGQGEVLVKVDARPIQPADFMFIGGRYRIRPQSPQVAGLEGSGVVVAAGPDVSVPMGTRVAFRAPGTWAEYSTVPAVRLHAVPPDIGSENAAQFSLNPITAWGLLDEARGKRDDWIAVNAATSTIAKIVGGLARRRGIRVLGLVRSGRAERLEFPTLATDGPGVAEKMLGVSGGVPFAALLDSIGGQAIMSVLPALRIGATIVSYGLLEQQLAPMGNSDMIYRNLCWKGFGIDYWLSQAKGRYATMTAELWESIRRGEIALPVRARYRLDNFQAALADAAASGGADKVLLAD